MAIRRPHGSPPITPFPDPATLFVQPDHYVFRMLYSQGISMEDLEIGQPELKNPRKVWHIFASNYYLFRGTPTRMWLDYAFQELFGLEERLSAQTADRYFDTISEKLQTSAFLPRALYDRFNLEVLSTTDSALATLDDHKAIRKSDWKARILPTFRPDAVVDPEFAGFAESDREAGRDHRRRHCIMEGLFEGIAQKTRRFSRTRLHRHRPWAPDRANSRPLHRGSGRAFPSRAGWRG